MARQEFNFLEVFQRSNEDWYTMEYPLQLLHELPEPHIVYWDGKMRRYAITAEKNEDILVRMEGIKIIARTSGLNTIGYKCLYRKFLGLT